MSEKRCKQTNYSVLGVLLNQCQSTIVPVCSAKHHQHQHKSVRSQSAK